MCISTTGLFTVVALVGVLLAPTAAPGQSAPTTNYTSIQANRGTPTQIGYHASAHSKTCTAAEPPTIRVLDAPDSGALAVQTAKLTTERISGCPRVTIPARVLLYTSNQRGGDSDHVIYEVTSADGKVAVYDITIKIKDKPAPSRERRLEQKI
jgi:hypothetical protein